MLVTQAGIITERRRRPALLGASALTAAAWLNAGPAAAQPAPSARPQGGMVVAGAASIASSPSATTIDQSSNRAAIDWTSFNVGSAQTVTFQQPSAAAITLNRVTGANPSAIAGHIQANGRIILINPSGVTFSRGAQVNAQSIVVSAAGMTNQAFMAGSTVFDQPGNANARIVNQGTLTVRQAGLAALVGPSVANAGVINARLGHVVMAGAQAVTLDMYGDGLVSVDVSGQVRRAPNGDGTALVTNTGTILADGGTVTLTAAAADGVVQTLVDAGGTVRADTVGVQTGQVTIAGTGGALVVDGQVAVDGLARGQRGGAVQIAASGTTTLAPGADVSAAGWAGGGRIAIGTTLARPIGAGTFPAGTSTRTVIAQGARISANATGRGNGGQITVLSSRATTIAGSLSARGGAQSGAGGAIELSGEHGFALTGTADTSAPHGALGTIVLDPTDLTIVANGATSNITPCTDCEPNIAYDQSPDEATVTEAQIEALTGNIALQAVNDLTVAAPLTLATQNLTLEAGNDLAVAAGVTISTAGLVTLTAAASDIPGNNPAGALSIGGAVISTGAGVTLNAGSGGITLAAPVQAAAGLVSINTGGVLSEQTGGLVSAATLSGLAASANLEQGGNQIGTLGSFATTGGFDLANGTASAPQSLTIAGPLTDGTRISITDNGPVTLAGDVQAPGVSIKALSTIGSNGTYATYNTDGTITQTAGSLGGVSISLDAGDALAQTGGSILATGAGSSIALVSNGALTLAGTLSADTMRIDANSRTIPVGFSGSATYPGIIGQTGGGITTGLLTGEAEATASFAAGGNAIARLGGFSSVGGFTLADTGALSVSGPLTDSVGVSLTIGGMLSFAGVVSAPTLVLSVGDAVSQPGGYLNIGTLSGTAGGLSLTAQGNAITTLASFASSGDFLLSDASPLSIAGTAGSTGAGATVAITADTQSFAPGGTLLASGGTVALEEYTPGAGITLGGGGGLGSNPPVVANTLQIGSPTGGAITVAGAFDLSGVPVLDLQSAGAVFETGGGALQVGTLSGVTASATLGGANQIATLGAFTTPGSFSLVDTADLVVSAALGAGAASLAAPDFSLLAPITVPGQFMLTAAGTISQGAGAIATGTLTGSAATASFSSPTNTIAALGGFDSVGGLTLADAGDLAIAGQVTAPSLALAVGGAVTQPGGYLAIGMLTGSAASLSLTAPGNSIATLGSVAVAGDLALADAAALTVAGPLTAASASLSTSAGLTLSGSLTVAQGLALTAGTLADGVITAGPIAQTAGTIGAGTLSGSASSADFGASANAVATLGSFTTADGFILADGGALAIAGPLTAGTSIALTTGQGMSLAAAISAPSLGLAAGGAINQSSGALAVGTLTGSAAGASLISATNSLETLGAFSSTGNFALTDAAPLVVAGTVSVAPGGVLTIADDAPSFGAAGTLIASGGTVALAEATPGAGLTLGGSAGFASDASVVADTLQIGDAAGGPITIDGGFSLTAVPVLDVQSAGAIAETGTGALQVGTLQGSAGSVALGGANSIVTLGPFTTAGAFALTDAQSLTIAGPLGAASANLAATGDLTLAADVGVTGALGLTATGALGQTAGIVTAASLTGAAASTSLAEPNAVATLTSFSSAGGFTLNDTGAPILTIAGPLTDPPSIALTANALTLAADITAPTLSIVASGAVMQTAGALAVGTLTGSAADLSLPAAANSIATLGGFSSSLDIAIDDAAPLALAGSVNAGAIALSGAGVTIDANVAAGGLTLALGGGVTQTGGTLTLATLGGSAGGAIDLGAAGLTRLSTLDSLTAGGALTLTDSQALTIAGDLAAPMLGLTAPGAITLNGGVLSIGGATPAGTTPAASFLQVAAGGDAAPSFTQTGTTTITPLNGASAALQIGVASGGTITLQDLQAPQIATTLLLGQGGRATGQLTVGSLSIQGSGGSAALTGSVGAAGGANAAIASLITPAADPAYELNGCEIDTASCVTVPSLEPAQAAELEPSIVRPDISADELAALAPLEAPTGSRPALLTFEVPTPWLDGDADGATLLLPNISDKDY